MKYPKFSHKTPHLKGKQHQLDPNLDLKQLVHHSTKQYVDRDVDGDVDVYDNPKKGIPDENVMSASTAQKMSKRLINKQKGELKHTKVGMAYEDLRKWFGSGGEGGVGGGGWDRYNTKGERIGKCGEGEEGEPYAACLSKEKAKKLGKEKISSFVKRKRSKQKEHGRDDKGEGGKGQKPIFVKTGVKEEMEKKKYPDHEHSMIRSELETIKKAVSRLQKKMKGEGNVEAWVQSKITKAADYIDSAADYIESGEHNVHGSMDEAKKSPCWKGYRKKPGTADYEKGSCVKVKEGIESGPILPKEKGKRVFPKGQEPKPTKAKLIKPSLEKTNINAGYIPSVVEKILLEMEAEVLTEKNKPTNPKLWAKWKSKAKAKFDVYPSAYANGWAAKGYKSEGGKWESVSEEIEEAVRIPSRNGNVILVNFSWRGKVYSIKMFFPQIRIPNRKEVVDELEKVYPGARLYNFIMTEYDPSNPLIHVSEDWQKVNRKDRTDGMSDAAVKEYRKQNPKSKLQTAVTEKNPTGKDADRQNAFCRRSKGQKDMHNIDCSETPDKPICKARRRWNCKGDS